jgi:hypothetical protein
LSLARIVIDSTNKGIGKTNAKLVPLHVTKKGKNGLFSPYSGFFKAKQ